MSKSKIDPSIEKADFITQLISMDKDEINEFIKKNGKPIKRINPFIVMDDINENNNMEEYTP